MASAFSLNIDNKGVATLLFDLPGEKANTLSLAVLEELDQLLDQLKAKSEVVILLVKSAKKGIFIAGADLKSFSGFFSDPQHGKRAISLGHSVFRKLETLPFPSIAVINGACLGGGLELALACTYRVAGDSEKTQIGLPETSLGLFPGWGGTQRFPRLVGFTQGITMVLTGKAIDAKKAWKSKLIDAVYPLELLEAELPGFIEQCLLEKGKRNIIKRRESNSWKSWLLEKNPIGRALVVFMARRGLFQKTKGLYPAPFAALDLIASTYTMPLEKGLEREERAFIEGFATTLTVAPKLIQIFFSNEALKKESGIGSEEAVLIRPIKAVGVVGAGVMGSGIAWLMSYREIPVRIKEMNEALIGKGLALAWKSYQSLIKIRKLTPTEAEKRFLLISGGVDYRGFHRNDLVIEAATEEPTLKKAIIKELEDNLSQQAIIATNTSSLTIAELACEMRHPERFLGLHFFNPPSRMPLVEVVAGEKTSKEVLATAVAFCKQLKKVPIVVKDCHGFLVNRLFGRGFVEIARMLEEGVAMERLERLFVSFGLPMAPFVLADEVGHDVNDKVFATLEKAYGERMKMPALIGKLCEKKFLGKKAGKGFYLYENKKKTPNPEVMSWLAQNGSRVEIGDEEIVQRAIYAMINEAALCLEEGVVTDPRYLDMALIYGIGFPPFRGGLLYYADTQGLPEVVKGLEQFEKKFGKRFVPTHLLCDMASKSEKFIVGSSPQ